MSGAPPSSYRYLYGRRVLSDYHRELGLTEGEEASSVPLLAHGGRPICIIGAGLSGLYAAMMLDSLGLKYEILEASDRVGGRLFTHRFSDKADVLQDHYEYFDVGADRFPKTLSMTRFFDLLTRLNVKTVPCYTKSDNTFLYFNSHRIQRTQLNASARPQPDHFHSAPPMGPIPVKYVEYGCDSLLSDAMEPFRQGLKKDPERGLDMLASCESYYARGYMTSQPLLQYPHSVARWCEMMSPSGGYNESLVEKVLDYMALDSPSSSANTGTQEVDWFCIDGGAQTLAEAMLSSLKNRPIKYNMHVAAVSPSTNSETMSVSLVSSARTRPYSHVLCTIPLPCLRTLDLTRCALPPATQNALRAVHAMPAIKIGIKFRENWWARLFGIVGGESVSDLPSRRVVYPSYGPADDSPKSKVLLVSYCRGQDALRLGALLSGPGSSSEQALLDLVFRDLAAVHGLGVEEIKAYYDWHYFPYDWARQPYAMGAGPVWQPGEWREAYPCLTRPAAGGRMHFVGDGTSAECGSVAGALESAWRGVYEILMLSHPEMVEKFKCMWGLSDEFEEQVLRRHVLAGLGSVPAK